MLTDPAGLFLDISVRLLHPTSHLRTYAVTLIFGSGLLLGYAACARWWRPPSARTAPQT